MSPEEATAFCQQWSACNPTEFNAYYESAAACGEGLTQSLNDAVMGYEMNYGAECAALQAQLYECYAATYRCMDGAWTYEYESNDACYTNLEEDIMANCSG